MEKMRPFPECDIDILNEIHNNKNNKKATKK